MHLFLRRSDDADVIRARLRALLDEPGRRGWLPEDLQDHPASVPTAADPVGSTGQPVDPGPEDAVPDGLPRGIGRHRSPGPALRWDPGRGGARALWLAGAAAALLLIGWTWLDRPQIEPVAEVPAASASVSRTAAPEVGEAAETSATVVVSVVGLVARPGLVTLPTGARVADALEAAGGLLPEADPASVNLAAVVADGQQVTVGVPGAAGEVAGGVAGTVAAGGLVDLNTASAADLDVLPGIGPVLAQRIVDHRAAEGPFRSVEELDDVPGIGPAKAAELAGLVTV